MRPPRGWNFGSPWCHPERSEGSRPYDPDWPSPIELYPSVILSAVSRSPELAKGKDLVLIGQDHPPCQSSLTSRHSGLMDSIKAIFFARTQPLICFSRARAAYTSDVSSK